MMDEVVVIGYGSVKKGDVTNAVAKVKGDQLKDRPVSNVASDLQGELAGVEIRTTSGAPGSGVQINVRGATSINESGNSNLGDRVGEQIDPLEHEGKIADEAVVAVFPHIPSAKAHAA